MDEMIEKRSSSSEELMMDIVKDCLAGSSPFNPITSGWSPRPQISTGVSGVVSKKCCSGNSSDVRNKHKIQETRTLKTIHNE